MKNRVYLDSVSKIKEAMRDGFEIFLRHDHRIVLNIDDEFFYTYSLDLRFYDRWPIASNLKHTYTIL